MIIDLNRVIFSSYHHAIYYIFRYMLNAHEILISRKSKVLNFFSSCDLNADILLYRAFQTVSN